MGSSVVCDVLLSTWNVSRGHVIARYRKDGLCPTGRNPNTEGPAHLPRVAKPIMGLDRCHWGRREIEPRTPPPHRRQTRAPGRTIG